MKSYECSLATHPLDKVVTVPGSKSITNRALVAAALANGTSVLTNILLAEDTHLMIQVLRALGIAVTIDEAGKTIEITGCSGFVPCDEATLFCGNSGTTLRFATTLVALAHGRFTLDGVPRLRQRPIAGLANSLRTLGTGVEYLGEEGFPPLVIHASGLRGGHVTFDAPPSSQFVSSLLLGAPYATSDIFIDVTNGTPSLPYLQVTTGVMERFGVSVIGQCEGPRTLCQSNQVTKVWSPEVTDVGTDVGRSPRANSPEYGACQFIVAAPQRYQAASLAIEPDASSATYFLAAAALVGGRVTIEGLGTGSLQGDVAFVDLLEAMGCRVDRGSSYLTVFGLPSGESLRGIEVDLRHLPDTVPTLAVVALFASGPTTIFNVAHLRLKESDRIAALAQELTKLGARVEEQPDALTIYPPRVPCAAVLNTHNDHRLAMSLALAGLRIEGVVINDPKCVAKSFPDFFDKLDELVSAGRST